MGSFSLYVKNVFFQSDKIIEQHLPSVGEITKNPKKKKYSGSE